MKKSRRVFIISLIVIGIIVILFYFFNKSKNDFQFSIENSYTEIKIGENYRINYKINSDIDIIWMSSDESIAKVDQNGLVSGIDYGMTIITGKVFFNDKEYYRNIVVNTYSGDKSVPLEKVQIPDGEILMRINSEYNIPFTLLPNNAYITSIKYDITDKNIIEVKNDKIIAKNIGKTELKIIINDSYNASILVNVVSDNVQNRIIKKLESISLKEEEINLKINEKKKIDYDIKPNDAYIENIKWESSDSNIVSVNDGEITANKSGIAIISLIINDTIKASLKVNVLIDASEIKVSLYPKTLLRIGETSEIIASVLPENATDKKIDYKSSNSSVVMVSNDGKVVGKSVGSATITLSIDSGKSMSINVNVLPVKGLINGTGNLWGYKSLNEKNPVRAREDFFQKLAQSGKGTLSNNIYTSINSGIKYVYDINNSVLNANGVRVMARFYYPKNTDLSSLNMFTFMGGDGENNFSGFFNSIDKDTSLIKSAGIVVLIAEGSRYNTKFDQYAANSVVNFAKLIFNQKNGVRNSIGGFSTGGTKVFWTADKYNFDRVIIYSSYFNWPGSTMNLKNKEIIFYIPNKDILFNQARSTLSDLKKIGYSNVTIVSNSSELANRFSKDFLVINPGSLMISSHVTENVVRSNMFSYANE